MLKPFPKSSVPCKVAVVKGVSAILKQESMLVDLSQRCGQTGAMHWLPYFLTARSMMKKEPYLVVLLREGTQDGSWRSEDVWAAVLMFEYRVLGMPTRAFSTDDVTGFRTVISPVDERAAVTAIAANAVLELGGQFVLLSYDEAGREPNEPRLTDRYKLEWAWRRRPVQKALRLGSSYEETLALLGKSTRFNLRYYRKRLAQKTTCEYVADARGMLQATELDALNAASLNPVSADQFRMRYKSASELPGGYVVGLRGGDGQWLSMVGGWRQGDVTVLHWQLNAAGFEKDSLGTVMRSYYLEHEVERGARTLVIYGGTVHSMGNSFVREEVTDLVVRRRSVRSTILRGFAKISCGLDNLLGRNMNFLARLIAREELKWQPARRDLSPETLVAARQGEQ